MTAEKIIRPYGIALLLLAGISMCAAQNNVAQKVPANARTAASMPRYAAKLAGHASMHRQSTSPRRVGMCSLPTGDQRLNPLLDVLYSNGPVNGTNDAWTINFGFVVADSFTLPRDSSAARLSFYAWLIPGDVVQSVEVSFTSQPFGGTSYFDGVVNLYQSDCSGGNQYGFNVCLETGDFNEVDLAPGTYWVNLQNAQVNTGDPVYWDENSGPSLADENSLGTIPSEAFTILGTTTTTTTPPPPPDCMPGERDSFKVIHNFTGGKMAAAPPA